MKKSAKLLILTLTQIIFAQNLMAEEIKINGHEKNQEASEEIVRPTDVLKDNQDSVTLPDGTIARKGTIKATIDNTRIINNLFKTPRSPEREKKIEEALLPIRELLPQLHSLDLFKFFTVSEWLQNQQNLGRIIVALVYIEKYFPEINAEEKVKIVKRIKELRKTAKEAEIKKELAKIKDIN